MHQTWLNLLFAHWLVDPALIRPLIPAGLALDLWEDRAWIGVVPFAMREIAHEPWTLNAASLELEANTVAAAAGITLPDQPPHLLFAKETTVQIWPLERLT
jgi:uncharacterized protein YqjF (DUF2071 family)